MNRSLETRVVWLAALIQLVNIVDFMMVMPLGPDLALALGIQPSHIGYIGGSYTLAAALCGLLCVRFLDRFDRRKAVLVTLAGLSGATLLAAFAWDLPSLLGARILAGLFGGPSTSLALSMVMDTVPPERRGRGMAIVMGAFSLAAIAGVPIGLELARLLGWQTPFYAVASVGALVWLAIALLLPPLRGHLHAHQTQRVRLLSLLQRREVQLAYLMVIASIFSAFLLIPNFSSYFQFNLGFPRESLGWLYFSGGLLSLVSMQLAGRWTDRIGALPVALVATLILVVVIAEGFLHEPSLPVLLLFVGFMAASSTRNVTATTVSSLIPEPWERAGYMSLQNAITHTGSGLAALTSSLLLSDDGNRLQHMPTVAMLALGITLLQPLLLSRLQPRVSRLTGHAMSRR